jgi:hypothetical protein
MINTPGQGYQFFANCTVRTESCQLRNAFLAICYEFVSLNPGKNHGVQQYSLVSPLRSASPKEPFAGCARRTNNPSEYREQ